MAVSWRPFGEELPLTLVNELIVVPGSNRLRAATFGRGVWDVDLTTGPAAQRPAQLYIRQNIIEDGRTYPRSLPGGLRDDPRLPAGAVGMDFGHAFDIRIDAPPYQFFDDVVDGVEFDERLGADTLVPLVRNNVYVQVHNSGHTGVDNVEVHLYFMAAGAALPDPPPVPAVAQPPLPGGLALRPPADFYRPAQNFDPVDPPVAGQWLRVGPAQTLARVAPDTPSVARFEWTVPASLAGGNVALLALCRHRVADDAWDPAPATIDALIVAERRTALRVVGVGALPPPALYIRDGIDDGGRRAGEVLSAGRSPDIIVVAAVPAQPAAEAFRDLLDVRPQTRLKGGTPNQIYVRVHNRGLVDTTADIELWAVPIGPGNLPAHLPAGWQPIQLAGPVPIQVPVPAGKPALAGPVPWTPPDPQSARRIQGVPAGGAHPVGGRGGCAARQGAGDVARRPVAPGAALRRRRQRGGARLAVGSSVAGLLVPVAPPLSWWPLLALLLAACPRPQPVSKLPPETRVELLDKDATAEPVAIPGGVANPSGEVGYVTAPDGALVALALATGEERWRGGPGYALAVAAAEGHLLAAVPLPDTALAVASIDTVTGARRFTSAPIAPVGATATSYQLLAVRQRGRRLVIAFRGASHPSGPAPGSSGGNAEREPRRQAGHAVQVDLDSGRVETIPFAPFAPATPPPLPPDAEALNLLAPGDGHHLWSHGDRLLGLSLESGHLVLRSWDAATLAPAGSHQLLDHLPAGSQYLTAWRPRDRARAYVVLCNDARLSDDTAAGERCRWLVWDAATGERIADVPCAGREIDPAPEPALVNGLLLVAMRGPGAPPAGRQRCEEREAAVAAPAERAHAVRGHALSRWCIRNPFAKALDHRPQAV